MNFEPVERLAGTRDLAGEDFASVDSLRLAMGAALSNAGYGRIETPILEKADLFFRKSGAEINSSLYSFTDPGGVKVSLRPEFTSSVIRNLIQDTESGSGPFRRSYSGPVFRYGEGPFRQMTQVGGELVGLAEPAADAEIIGLAVRCAQEAKIDDFTVRVGHLGVIHDVMRWFDLSEPVMMFVAGAMQGGSGLPKPSEDLLAMAQASGLVSSDDAATAADADSNVMTDESMRTLLRESIGAPIGRRTIEDVLDRLVRKKRDAAHPTSFLGAVDALRRLAKVQGRPDEVAEAARDALSCNGLPSEILENLERVVTHLEDDGFPLERLTIDLSFARGIAYYTGLVFEIQLAGPDGGVLSVGGGGRYDGLVKALGGAEDTPALGFAFTLEQILSARESSPGRQRVDGKRG